MRIFILLSAIFMCYCYASYDYYRLPTSIRPIHYNLRILTHLEDASRLFFTGDVEIHFRALLPTRNITLHVGAAVNIANSATCLESARDNCDKYFKIKSVQRNSNYDYYIIHLDTNLWPRQRYLLRLQFSAQLGRSMSGYYASSYRDNDNSSQIKFMSVTQFEPADARAAFPCFDEPAFKATFNITLGHPSHFNALSNMPILKRVPMCERHNWVWSIFKQTEAMSTYLVAYSINDFDGYVSKNPKYARFVKFTTWARSSAIEQCRYAAQIGPRILRYYESMFDIEYPLPKMDQLAVPDFSAGAMENWGLITYREASLFYSPKDSSQTDKQHISNIIAHELAHQWFGNLVTMEWWNDLWLNEGFATYIATLGMDKLCRKWNAYEEESLENVLAILSTDAYCNTRAVHQAVSQPAQIAELFDAITYRKGAVIIRMMHMFIGDAAFRQGLKHYLLQHAYGNARQEDLWQTLTQAAHECGTIPLDLDVGTVMDTWTLQQGIPLIVVDRHYGLKSATVTQRRFFRFHDPMTCYKKPACAFEADACWFVPLSYTMESESNFISTEPRAWLRCNEQHDAVPLKLEEVSDEDDWLILNIKLTTPYRVNYDTRNWELIIRALHRRDFNRIHVMNRAQLIDDVMALAWSGHVYYALALELLDYLRQEYEYMPWRAALDQLAGIERIMEQTEEFDEFQHFMYHLLQPIYCHLGGMQKDYNNKHHVAHKNLINGWACRLCHADCVRRALRYFHRWLILSNPDQKNPVPRNLRSVVYCTAMRHGDADDWNFLWQRYRNTAVASEQRLMLLALSCTHDVRLIERYLRITFCPKSAIRKQDASTIFVAILRNRVGLHVARDFFLYKFKLLRQFYGPNRRELAAMLIQITHHVSREQDYRRLRIFIETHKGELKFSARSLQRALEQARLNLYWRQELLSQFVSNLEIIYND